MAKRLTVYWYPKCGTCRKAKKWLDDHGVDYDLVDIVENPPDAETIRRWVQRSGLDVRRFFNTSGQAYRQMGLKDKLPHMDEEAMIQLLASDGKLIKRPIVTDGERVTVGFTEASFVPWASI